MEYPVWWIPSLSAALAVAVIATIHVFIAHFAIGGGLFLVFAERVGLKDNSDAKEHILAYVKRHTRFFLLLTLVAGGLTGVGIWFVIGVASPAATSALINIFVFGWATEWVFFIGEIVALLVYYYTFGKMRPREHQIVGWLYFIFAWLSLFMINGIIGFMLTPGEWAQTKGFWDGFFNPSFWPSLVFRTMLCALLAGVLAYFTAIRIPDENARERMIRFSTWWVAGPFLLVLLSGAWYLMAMPPAQMDMIMNKSQEIPPMLSAFLVATPLVFLGALAMAFLTPQSNRRPLAWLLLILAFIQLGAFEYIREAGRRPYLIWEYMYSNSIHTADVPELGENGFLSKAKWVRHKEITDENRLEVGEDIFRIQCANCHSIGGPMLNIIPRTAKYTQFGMEAQLRGQGLRSPYMPPFVGNADERAALAAYVVEGLNGNQPQAVAADLPQLEVEPLPYDDANDQYLLLAWNTTGMHLFSDASRYFSLMPAGNTIYAQLLERGPLPTLITEDVTLHYSLEEGYQQPAKHLRLWEYSRKTFDIKAKDNVGLTGAGVEGEMQPDAEQQAWTAEMVPVSPYDAAGNAMPYPLVTIEARDKDGNVLAQTRTVAPASTEMGCKNCHGGEWRMPSGTDTPPIMGIDDTTALDILAMHDKRSGTKLKRVALSGKPEACQSCHPDAGMKLKKGDNKRIGLSAAIHGFHAPYLQGAGADACNACHASSPEGATRMLRDLHNDMMLSCTDCHGSMTDHSLALLKAELESGRQHASEVMKGLTPEAVESVEEIAPRKAWVQQPDCLSCHVLDGAGGEVQNYSAFNLWTEPGKENLFRMRHDYQGAMMCTACHNSPHAVYPATNPYGENRDALQPMRYMGMNRAIGADQNCQPCHTMDMGMFPHHPSTAP